MPCFYENCRFNNYFSENELVASGANNLASCIFHANTQKNGDLLPNPHFWNNDRRKVFNEKLLKVIESRNRTGVELRFDEVVFPEIDLSGIEILHILRFRNCIFIDEANFQNTIFKKGMYFEKGVIFMNNAFFEGADFISSVRFTKTNFNGYSTFEDVTFRSAVSFQGSSFENEVTFERIKVERARMNFSAVNFHGEVLFSGSEINGSVSFLNATFGGGIDFVKAYVKEAAIFSYTLQDKQNSSFQTANFAYTEFAGGCDFTNRVFSTATKFTHTIFAEAPKFHGALIHQDTDFENVKFNDVSYASARAYRTLKLVMENHRAHREEAMFFALEQRCNRNNPYINIVTRIFSYLYDLTSGYGESLVRPLVTFIFTLALFTIFYALIESESISMNLPIDWSLLCDSFIFSVEQAFNPFYIWRDADTVPALKILASIQSIITLSLLAVFLIALRWNFKKE